MLPHDAGVGWLLAIHLDQDRWSYMVSCLELDGDGVRIDPDHLEADEGRNRVLDLDDLDDHPLGGCSS